MFTDGLSEGCLTGREGKTGQSGELTRGSGAGWALCIVPREAGGIRSPGQGLVLSQACGAGPGSRSGFSTMWTPQWFQVGVQGPGVSFVEYNAFPSADVVIVFVLLQMSFLLCYNLIKWLPATRPFEAGILSTRKSFSLRSRAW